ncbi:MAG TPA: helix-turn-helix transcriptional regulator [Candidatus Wallbacteria bacterium]|nr:helix-turn-helix transcriptional regulator [Candidatus Wallbacteria bacterium]
MVKNLIGERIKHIREKAGQSQEAFARTMGVTPATINRYEKGHRIPDADFLKKVIAEYSCDPAWLLTGADESRLAAKLKHDNLQHIDPDIEEIVVWLTEVPEAKPLFLRLVKAYREFDAAVGAIRQLGVRNLEKIKS